MKTILNGSNSLKNADPISSSDVIFNVFTNSR